MSKMQTYTVIGLWDGDSEDRFAELFSASSAAAAEQQARVWAEEEVLDAELVIAATIVGGDYQVAS